MFVEIPEPRPDAPARIEALLAQRSELIEQLRRVDDEIKVCRKELQLTS